MQSLLNQVKNLSVRQVDDIIRQDRVEGNYLCTEIIIHISQKLNKPRHLSVDCALPTKRKHNVRPDWLEDVSEPTPLWTAMTNEERLSYLDREIDEYMGR
jgi:hypothetical protein